jgi:glycosyltransferase involved in cell wall biosynthesis
VGGVTPPYYDLRPLFEVVQQLDRVRLTVCCRKGEWQKQKEFYSVGEGRDVEVVHAHSNEIGQYYRRADLVTDLRRPEGYLRTALPIKIVEAIGYGVPTVLLQGTAAAEFVEEEGVGWTFGSISEARGAIRYLRDHRGKIEEKGRYVERVRPRHTWEARARKAASLLTGAPVETETALDVPESD